jgi:ribosome maturation factor RimP
MENVETLRTDIEVLARPICEVIGIEIIEISVKPHNGVANIQVFADKPLGGIGMAECVRLNQALVEKLDNELALGDNYTLEVSSPGLDRDLKGVCDLRRVTGRLLQIFLKAPVNGKRELSGVLEGVRENEIVVRARHGEVLVSMDNIEKAKQIIN